MAQNAYMEIDTTRNGNTDQQYPIADESQVYRPSTRWRGANFFNMSIRNKQSKDNVGDWKIKVFNEVPLIDRVIVTVGASAGDTSLTVNDATMIRNGEDMYHFQTNQRITVNALPTSNVISVDAIDSAIPAGTYLKILGPAVVENWVRSTPLERATNFHTDYISVLQWSLAFTWFMQNRKMYVEPEEARLRKQFDDRVQMFVNEQLMYQKSSDGTSSGKFRTNGLVPQAKQYNRIVTPGALTTDLINQGGELLRNWGNAEGMLELIMAPSLKARVSNWPFQMSFGIARTAADQRTFGVKPLNKVDSAIDGIDGYYIQTDMSMEQAGLNNCVLMVNWSGVRPVRNGADYLQKNVQDPGSGAIMDQLTRSVGFEYPISAGAAVIFENVNTFIA